MNNEILKGKVIIKIEKEYKEFLDELIKERPEVIIERSYEKVSKEELKDLLYGMEFSNVEAKALLKESNILESLYDSWIESDLNYNELLEEVVIEEVGNIREHFRQYSKSKNGKIR
ncbi:MAG: DUF3848 domain-containing protein [Clostridia bacterium]|nr:DUF3848 domain-containing protein [Clostridia bacterium]